MKKRDFILNAITVCTKDSAKHQSHDLRELSRTHLSRPPPQIICAISDDANISWTVECVTT